MSDLTINQHYISRTILKHFANSKDQVFETLVDEDKIYPTNYKNSMSERFTYEHPILETNQLENFFTSIESDFGPALNQVIDLLDKNKCTEAYQIMSSFSSAFIIFYYRSGALLNEFSFETKQREDRVGYLLEKLTNTSYINSLGDTLKLYDYAFIKADNKGFLISDQYISTVALGIKGRFTNISNRHIGLKDVMILIPISSQYYLVYYHGKKPNYIVKNKINILNEVQVDEVNKVIINNSYVKCVGQIKEALERAKLSFRFSSPAATFMEFNSGVVSGATLKKELFFYEDDQIAWEIFTEPMSFIKFRDLGRNDKCGCGSGKKFKICCYEYFEIVKKIWIAIRDKDTAIKIRLNPRTQIELSITEFYSKKTS